MIAELPFSETALTRQRRSRSDFSGRLRKAEWEVRPVSIDIARELVTRYHYAKGASNTATHLHGLFRKGAFWESECVGVAWWIPPTRTAAEATHPDNWQGVLALSRLAIAPEVPKNACTFLLARSGKQIPRRDWPCFVTYADTWRGHEGGIYLAAGWQYMGLTTPERTYTVGGVMTARKAGGKTRTHAEMLALGAQCEGSYPKHKFALLRVGAVAPPSQKNELPRAFHHDRSFAEGAVEKEPEHGHAPVIGRAIGSRKRERGAEADQSASRSPNGAEGRPQASEASVWVNGALSNGGEAHGK